jgi:RHS repeat-associated protein
MVNGLMVSRTWYDEFGHQDSLLEVNSGKTIYTHNILGELTRQEDAKGNFIQEIIYDEFGRMTSKEVGKNGGVTRNYTYTYNNNASTSGFGQLVKEEVTGGVIAYTNDYIYTSSGQVSQIWESTPNSTLPIFKTEYLYSQNGQLSHEKFYEASQNQVILQYNYTNNGHLLEVIDASGTLEHSVYYFHGVSQNAFGQWTEYQTLGHTATSKSYTKSGLLTEESSHGGQAIREREYSFNQHNGNLTSRSDPIRSLEESFNYDDLDRLTDIYVGEDNHTETIYNANGNIAEFKGVGEYSYHPTKKHAVTKVSNNGDAISSGLQQVSYDELHNPSTIEMGDKEWEYFYGPNHERRSVNMKDNTQGSQHWRQRLYTTNAEYIFDGSALHKQIMYISGGDGLCGIIVYDVITNETHNYAVFTDYLGSIEVITDELGQEVIFEQSFDAWGKYRDPDTWATILQHKGDDLDIPDWLWRGYTGHEMLNDFELIHMNGRLYDPYVARMLSPDNFVQDATSTQNYNRYSYVLNNPLKYTDPDGEIAFLAVVAIVGGVSGGLNLAANWDNVDNFGDGAFYFGVGAAVGAGATIGDAALAPVIGTGAISGAAFGAVGGFVTGYANTGYASADWGALAFKAGGEGALRGAIGGAVIAGGISGFSGNNVWTGATPSNGASVFSFKDIGANPRSPSFDFKDAYSLNDKNFWKYGHTHTQDVRIGQDQNGKLSPGMTEDFYSENYMGQTLDNSKYDITGQTNFNADEGLFITKIRTQGNVINASSLIESTGTGTTSMTTDKTSIIIKSLNRPTGPFQIGGTMPRNMNGGLFRFFNIGW